METIYDIVPPTGRHLQATRKDSRGSGGIIGVLQFINYKFIVNGIMFYKPRERIRAGAGGSGGTVIVEVKP
jgi:hypothetical protein